MQNGDSKEEHFYVPTFHYVSPMIGDWRYGLSIVAPGGLSKRWDEAINCVLQKSLPLKLLK